MLQNTSQTENRSLIAFESKLEDVPGGVTIAAAGLTQASVLAGTPIGKDASTGLYHVVKTALLHADAANDATGYQVKKGHNFKVGDFVAAAKGAKAYAIASITTTEADYDTITLGTTLGVAYTAANGVVLFQAAAEAASNTSAFKYAPVALVGESFDVGVNNFTQAVVRGTAKLSAIPPIGSVVKAEAGLSLIRFV